MARRTPRGARRWEGSDANERAYNSVHNALTNIIIDGPNERSAETLQKANRVLVDLNSQTPPAKSRISHDVRINQLRRMIHAAEEVVSGRRAPTGNPKHGPSLREQRGLIGPGTDGIYKYRGASIELNGSGRHWHATVRFRSQEKDFDGRSSDEALEKAQEWIDAAPELRASRRSDDGPISMTYGELPPFEQFWRDIRRPDPDSSDGDPYWPGEGTLYPMELVNSREIELAEEFGEFEEFRGQYGKRGFRGDERQIYDFLVFLMGQDDAYDFEEGGPADFASSIMTTLGYEWI